MYSNGYFGAGTGDIVIDDLRCSGSEEDVQFCPSSPWLTSDCDHWQDVGIDCGKLNNIMASPSKARRLRDFQK